MSDDKEDNVVELKTGHPREKEECVYALVDAMIEVLLDEDKSLTLTDVLGILETVKMRITIGSLVDEE